MEEEDWDPLPFLQIFDAGDLADLAEIHEADLVRGLDDRDLVLDGGHFALGSMW